MNLKEWAASQGVAYVTARRQYAAGKLPVPTYPPGRLIMVGEPLACSTEVGSAFNGHREKFLALLCDPAVGTIVVEHRDRFACFGAEYVEAALSAQGRRLLVVDPAGVDNDLVRDVTETLTSLCARRYGRRAAADRARPAVEVACGDDAA
ncbi:recombinase family protein [Micromonospora sonchi]|uniref:recombinase family protein n=1 Tax=Micromonospora sonchi TaxID=1763543 RepID=UPI00166CDC51|nr:recombinase family protein [Micromonospora sonchi]